MTQLLNADGKAERDSIVTAADDTGRCGGRCPLGEDSMGCSP